MSKSAIEEDPWSLANVLHHLKIQNGCSKAVEEDSFTLKTVLYRYKIADIYKRAVGPISTEICLHGTNYWKDIQWDSNVMSLVYDICARLLCKTTENLI